MIAAMTPPATAAVFELEPPELSVVLFEASEMPETDAEVTAELLEELVRAVLDVDVGVDEVVRVEVGVVEVSFSLVVVRGVLEVVLELVVRAAREVTEVVRAVVLEVVLVSSSVEVSSVVVRGTLAGVRVAVTVVTLGLVSRPTAVLVVSSSSTAGVKATL